MEKSRGVKEKACPRCEQVKPLDGFYTWRGKTKSHCRACELEKARGRRLAGRTQEAARRRYASNELERARRRANARAWKARNPEKVMAERVLYAEIRSGRLRRQPCEVCGEKAHAHHADYAKPLEVVWLCPLHHMRQHVVEGRLRPVEAPRRPDRASSHVLVAPRDLLALLGDVTP